MDEPIEEPLDEQTSDQDSALRRRVELPRKLPDEAFVDAEGGGAEPSLLARMARSDIVAEELESEAGEPLDEPGTPAPAGRVDAAAAVGDGDEPPDTNATIEPDELPGADLRPN
jgi:hypothetical protein